jgi:hypothetical protein
MSLIKRQLQERVDTARFGGDIDALAKYWAERTVEQFKKEITKKDIVLTQELLNSFQIRVTEGQNPSIIISYSAHGSYLDMKALFWTKMPPVDVLTEWVKKRGVNNFRYVPGYEGSLRPDDDTAAKRIAWAIGKNRISGETINQHARWKKRKVWQQPALGKAVAYMANLLTEELAATASNDIIRPIINR